MPVYKTKRGVWRVVVCHGGKRYFRERTRATEEEMRAIEAALRQELSDRHPIIRQSKQLPTNQCAQCGNPTRTRQNRFCSRACGFSFKKAKPKDDVARFWSLVNKTEDGCWTWTGGKRRRGYGSFWASGRNMPAHRFAWIIGNGLDSIPDGMYVCHKCDNPPCVRPDHLFLGTPKENMQDCSDKGRLWPGTRSSKLTPSAVLEIRDRIGSGESERSIARDYGISGTTVHAIKIRKFWNWVGETDEASQAILRCLRLLLLYAGGRKLDGDVVEAEVKRIEKLLRYG